MLLSVPDASFSTPWRRFAAIALVSAAVVLLQIAVTRLLSVMLWYHWAFFAISLAMLGVGAPGVWLSFVEDRERWLRPLLLWASITVPLGILAMLHVAHLFPDYAILVCLACLLPGALCMGGAVCVLLLEAKGRSIARMYAFDLLGACVGALAVIPLLWTVPTPRLAAAVGLLPLAGYVLVGGRRVVAGVLALASLGLLVTHEPLRLKHSKGYAETTKTTTPIFERWTPTARITVFDNIFWKNPGEAFGWGLGARPPQEAPQQWWIEQDGSAGTPITSFDGKLEPLRYLLWDVTGAGYEMRPPDRVAIIGTGGGRDVLTARLAGARNIDAIELNGALVEALRGPFAAFSGGVYDLPGVRPLVGEGRSVLTRSAGGYDLIQISLIDSWAATAAGAYSLSENALYTMDSYRLYFSKLTPNGLVSTSRWLRGSNGIEIPRLVLLVQAALRAEGIQDPNAHMALVQGGAVGTVLMSRTPLSAQERERLASLSAERGWIVHWPPTGVAPRDLWLRRVVQEGPVDPRFSGLRLHPPTDDAPFFFQVLSPFTASAEKFHANGVNGEGMLALQRLIIVMGAITLALFFAPFLFGGRAGKRIGAGWRFWGGSIYFISIGVGFMLIELSWLQRLILYLGHPSHATTVGVGAMLAGAGLGSMASARVDHEKAARWGFVVPLFLLLVNTVLAPVFAATLGAPMAGRVAIAVLLLAPAAFLMGFCFPIGMVRFGERSRAWFWALNGAAGVLSSVLSLALAMQFGLAMVGQLGAAVYVVVWLLVLVTSPAPAPVVSTATQEPVRDASLNLG